MLVLFTMSPPDNNVLNLETSCRGGVMYLHAIGWQLGKKDKIDLDWQKLRDRQGLYSCPPINENQKPFYCCLEVQEDKLKVNSPDYF